MIYDPTRQYRCTIIRGKAQRELDDLLSTYIGIIYSITPSNKTVFSLQFNEMLALHLFRVKYNDLSEDNRKTVRNHITEIAGKLFALYFVDENDNVYCSESCLKLIEDSDQIAFFKNLCFNFQQPNGTQKIQTLLDKLENNINSRPLHVVLSLLELAHNENEVVYKDDLSYYVLNSLDVLQGWVSPIEIWSRIILDRSGGFEINFPNTSRDSQHIREQLNLLSLANLILIDGNIVKLNVKEEKLIRCFSSQLSKPLSIDPKNFDFTEPEQRSLFTLYWSRYNGSVNIEPIELLDTSKDALEYWKSVGEIGDKLTRQQPDRVPSSSLKDTGDEGEFIILDFERDRVGKFNPRLINKVVHVGQTRGLGYDIASVEADELPSDPEFARYIEVKTTKRATRPDFKNSSWTDSVNLTRREWLVARQFSSAYNIYRVYLTPMGINIIKIANPFQKSEDSIISVEPITYRMDFETKGIDTYYK